MIPDPVLWLRNGIYRPYIRPLSDCEGEIRALPCSVMVAVDYSVLIGIGISLLKNNGLTVCRCDRFRVNIPLHPRLDSQVLGNVQGRRTRHPEETVLARNSCPVI